MGKWNGTNRRELNRAIKLTEAMAGGLRANNYTQRCLWICKHFRLVFRFIYLEWNAYIIYRWMYKSKLCKFFIRIGDSVHALATCIVHYYVMYNVQTVGRSQQISISIFLIAKSESFRIEKREERKKRFVYRILTPVF